MGWALDHVFICCAPGAPQADALLQQGLVEGSGNTHPGQGTANRRFFFAEGGFIELLWVAQPAQACSALTSPTRLWPRWVQRAQGACPFGLAFRATGAVSPVACTLSPAILPALPFDAWEAVGLWVGLAPRRVSAPV